MTQWIIKSEDLQNLITGGIPSSLLDAFLETAIVAYGITSSPWVAPGLGGTPYVIYTSWTDPVAGLAAAIDTLPGPYAGVIFDLEAWVNTPDIEQLSPWYYQAQAAQACYALGMPVICTPGMDLIPVVSGGTASISPANYVSWNFAHDAAMVSDGIVIQAQRYDATPATFSSFIDSAAPQARTAHPGVNIYAGISTCASGVPVTGAQMYAAYSSVSIYGFWLNVPVWSSCPGGNPSAGIDFLSLVYPDA